MRGSLLLMGIFFFISPLLTLGQELQNVQVRFEQGQISVLYDIVSSDVDQLFEFYLYGSHDNYSMPLLEVTGDVGQKLSPGPGKVIYWDARKEFGNFKGDLNLKIKGGTYTPLLTLDDFTAHQKIKKSKPVFITWKSASEIEEFYFEILQDGNTAGKSSVIKNTEKYTWPVPKELKPGKGYQVKISSKDNPLKYELSEKFTVRRKTPTILKIAPIALAGGAAYFLLGNSTSQQDVGDELIPDPPTPK